MKRLFIITLFCALIFPLVISSVSAVVCSDSSQTIMRLSSTTNAHGEVWNGAGNYLTEVCYDTIFFSVWNGANPQTCASNTVLKLSSSTNAHAAGPQDTTYTTSVCYGDLVCTLKQGVCDTANNEREIVSLSTPTNAHLEVASLNNYQYRVCCSSPSAGGTGAVCGNGIVEGTEQCDGNTGLCSSIPGGFTGGTFSCSNQCTYITSLCTGATSSIVAVHWEDFLGNKIGNSVGIGTYVNRSVRMVADSTFPIGTAMDYSVNEKDLLFDDHIRSFTATTDSSGKAVAIFKITDADIAAGKDFGEGSTQQFYFVASAGSSNFGSEILDVSETQGPNNPPIANITAPVHRGVYYNGTKVLFNQSSYDLDGPLKFGWTIAEDNYKDNSSSFFYNFTKPGMKTITLRVTDDAGAWDEQEVTILVVASPGMLAYINKPFNKQVVPAQSGSLYLNFAANESFVVNNNVINAGTCNTGMSCLAGNCPSQTENSPSYCGGGPIPIANHVQTFAQTTFNWTIGNDGQKLNGVGDGFALGGREFSFNQAGPQTMSLLLSYNNTLVGISQNANRAFTMGQCIDTGHTFIKINQIGKEVSRGSTISTDYCTGQDGSIGGGDDCCPSGFACGNSNNIIKCYGNNITSCSQYTENSTCVNANPVGFPEYSQSRCGETVNGSVISCQCSWKNTDSTCFLNVTSRSNTCVGVGCTTSASNYQCQVLSYTEHECVNGYADVDIVRLFIPGVGATNASQTTPPCVNETITGVLCGKPSFDLDFVSDWTIFISVMFIGGIYIVLYAFGKNEDK